MTDEGVAVSESLLEFPCEFPIKVMGHAAADFDALVVSLVRIHVPELGEGAVRTRTSSGGKYLAVTVTVRVTSQDQLDSIYRELSGHRRVLMVL
jgi:putative lipoic acid-binding regulatory protein